MQMRVARHAIVSLTALHRMNIIHGAICPAHIEYSDTSAGRRFKLSKFTCACVVPAPENAVPASAFPKRIPGPAKQYAAPERWRGSGEITKTADVFSYGVTMYHLLTGRLPHEMVNGEIKPVARPRTASRRGKVPANMYHLLEQCMRRSPGNRPTARQVEKGLRLILDDLVQHDSSFAKGNMVRIV
jgi:serine/threonine-protein kinase